MLNEVINKYLKLRIRLVEHYKFRICSIKKVVAVARWKPKMIFYY